VAKSDPVAAGDGVVSLMERIWPSFQGIDPTSARLLPVNAEPATVSRSWQARTLRLTAAGPSADDAEARRSQVEQ
jgi:hypothetical protein